MKGVWGGLAITVCWLTLGILVLAAPVDGPQLSAKPPFLARTLEAGTVNIQNLSVQISSEGESIPIVVSKENGSNWFSFAVGGNTTPASVFVTQFDASNLLPGVYSDRLVITAIATGVMPLYIPITMTVTPATFRVNPDWLHFEFLNGSLEPMTHILDVNGMPGLFYTVTVSTAAWLTATVRADNIVPDSISVSVDPALLSPPYDTALLFVTADERAGLWPGNVITIPVGASWSANATPAITLTPTPTPTLTSTPTPTPTPTPTSTPRPTPPAEGDLHAPVLVALSLEPVDVVTVGDRQLITVTAYITDDWSGVHTLSLYFASDVESNQSLSVHLNWGNQVSGDEWEGVYRSRLAVPQYSASGGWHLSAVYLRDQVGNQETRHNTSPGWEEWLGSTPIAHRFWNNYPHHVYVPVVGR